MSTPDYLNLMATAAKKTKFTKEPQYIYCLVDPDGPFGFGWRDMAWRWRQNLAP